MANSLLAINLITREAVRLWKNSNAFIQNVDMQYDESFAVTGAKIGSALRIRLPNDFTVTTGPALSVQDTGAGNAKTRRCRVLDGRSHSDLGRLFSPGAGTDGQQSGRCRRSGHHGR